MAHIPPPSHLLDFGRFTGFELGLDYGQIVHVIPRTGRRVVYTNWAKWVGRFVIQRLKQTPAYDNTKPIEQDVQTWLDALEGQMHTTDIPIVEPTIELPDAYAPSVTTPVIEDGLLALTVNDGTSQAVKEVGDVLFLGSPKRLYKLVAIDGLKWLLTPAVLPLGDTASDRIPQEATSLKVRVLTSTSQYRARAGRGGWDVGIEEVIE